MKYLSKLKNIISIISIFTFLSIFPMISSANVAYIGHEGSYSNEAARAFFENKEFLTPALNVETAINEIVSGKNTYGVIPIESSMTGVNFENIDVVLNDYRIVITREVNITVTQAVVGYGNTELSNIKVLYATNNFIKQNEQWLKTDLPNARVQVIDDPAEGAKIVFESKNSAIAAISSLYAASMYNLSILNNNIQSFRPEVIKFWVVAPQNRVETTGVKASIFVSGPAPKLNKFLEQIASQPLELISIQSRPVKGTLNKYKYYIELEVTDKREKRDKKDILSYLSAVEKNSKDFSIRLIGIYDVTTAN